MRPFLAFLFRLIPIQILLSTLLLVILFFGTSLSAIASQSALDKGTVQLDEITQKTEAAAKTSAMSLNPIGETAEAGPNEIQGKADRKKMIRSKDTELPVVKEVKKALKK